MDVMRRRVAWYSLFLALVVSESVAEKEKNGQICVEKCFSALNGNVDDCCSDFSTVNEINKDLVEPLEDLIGRTFFTYYKTNVFKPCPFWKDDSMCGRLSCALKECKPDELPSVFRFDPHLDSKCEDPFSDDIVAIQPDSDEGISERLQSIAEFDRQELFWEVADQDEYPDPNSTIAPSWYRLKDNPERFTGYIGDSAALVWKIIYDENCFLPEDIQAKSTMELLKHENVNQMCVEKRAFYRLISGLHTSITTHVCSEFFDSSTNAWGPNADMFYKKFSAEYTWGEGPHRLRNLYFAFLFVLRAIEKAEPYWEKYHFYTGNEQEDQRVKQLVERIGRIAHRAHSFDESVLFGGDAIDAEQLKMQFRNKFHNISRIMDCVGCTKCRLWGKIQIQGLGTAIKILFTNAEDCGGDVCPQERPGLTKELGHLHLRRNEVVSLFQTLEHFSYSIHSLGKLRSMYIPDPKTIEKTIVKKSNPFIL